MRYLIQALLTATLSILSCTPGGEEACDNNPYYTPFFCYVYDKDRNETIVGRCINCPYSNELSTLRNENGDTIKYDGTITSDGAMRFLLVQQGIDSLNSDINKKFYLHLVDFNGVERDIDTIRFRIEIAKSNKCDLYEYKSFECYYNDSLYLTSYPWNISGSRVIFYK
ncbi:MAG: hypothetical protein M3Q56_07860 [Bacteroidota bacterium]|nr:hypothetical protein [Bacteroidota bacterium]